LAIWFEHVQAANLSTNGQRNCKLT
jgi:hypothetical protein